jgi:hypothetical protein
VIRDPEKNFESLWNTFHNRYPFFQLRHVDWKKQYGTHRFIRDLGTVYIVAGLAMPRFALDAAARPAAQAGAAFLVLHAIVHLWDAAAGREHVHALLVEIPLAQNTVAVAHGGTLRGLIVQLDIHSAEEAPHLDIARASSTRSAAACCRATPERAQAPRYAMKCTTEA